MNCECNLTALSHAAGQCDMPASYSVLRGETRLNLCYNCTLPEDRDRKSLDGEEEE